MRGFSPTFSALATEVTAIFPLSVYGRRTFSSKWTNIRASWTAFTSRGTKIVNHGWAACNISARLGNVSPAASGLEPFKARLGYMWVAARMSDAVTSRRHTS